MRTSGARAGGAVPEFLEKPTEIEQHDVVESLVSAAARKTEPLPMASPPPPQKVEPSREVLEQLLPKKESQDGKQEPPPVKEQSPKQKGAERERVKRTGDAGVIGSLLGSAQETSPPDDKR